MRRQATAPTGAARSATHPFWYTDASGGRGSTAGMHVTPDTALTISAVYRAVRLLADDVAQLPLHLFMQLPEREGGKPGGKQRLRTPLAEVIGESPNPRQTSYEFRQMLTAHALLRGNGYAHILSGSRGFVDRLEPIHPARMSPRRLDSGRVLYLYRTSSGGEERLTQDEVMHLRGFSIDPEDPCGMSPVTLARVSLGLSMATEEFGSRQFSQTPRPSFAITSPNDLGKDRRKELGESFRNAFGHTSGWGGVPVMDQGMSVAPIGMSHDDAQFLETRQFQVADVARWFGVQPHKLGDLSNATFSNIEHENQSYVSHGLMTWLCLWVQTIKRDLILDDAFAEFILNALLRGDALSRAQAYQIHANMKALTPNEIRELENRNPVEWGDEPLETQGAPAPAQPGRGPGTPAAGPIVVMGVEPPNRIRAPLNGDSA